MDEVIFEEFKGTGNSEIVLDRKLMEKRIFPTLDINKSGTRKEELLLSPADLIRITALRQVLHPFTPIDAMEFVLKHMRPTRVERRIPRLDEPVAPVGSRHMRRTRSGSSPSSPWGRCSDGRRVRARSTQLWNNPTPLSNRICYKDADCVGNACCGLGTNPTHVQDGPDCSSVRCTRTAR